MKDKVSSAYLKFEGQPCPACGKKLNAMKKTAEWEDIDNSQLTVTMCLYCQAVLIVDMKDYSMRIPTEEENQTIIRDPMLQLILQETKKMITAHNATRN